MPGSRELRPDVQAEIAEGDIQLWNTRYDQGTLVSFENFIGRGETHRGRTTTPAMMVGGIAVVWLEGYSGCVAIEHCTVLV